MSNADEIKAAVDLMRPEDFDNGTPKLDVVRRIANDETITAEAVKAAVGTTLPNDSAKADISAQGVIAQASTNGGADNSGAMHSVDPDDKPDEVFNPLDPNAVKLATAAAAQDELAHVQEAMDALERQKAALAASISVQDKRKAELEKTIEANTVQLSQADMVKRIQKQTQARLMAQVEAKKKIQGVLNTAGVKTYASPLDAALAGGAKRTKAIVGGKVFEAPHPRSPEGVRSYANWVHNGQKLPA